MAGLRDLLQAVYEEHGYLTPALVRDVARDPGHALHQLVFDKSVDDAAESYYLDRAHQLIRSVKITYNKPDGPPVTIRGFHCVKSAEGFVYHPADRVAADPLLSRILIADMEREWRTLKQRWEQFGEFWELVRRDAVAS